MKIYKTIIFLLICCILILVWRINNLKGGSSIHVPQINDQSRVLAVIGERGIKVTEADMEFIIKSLKIQGLDIDTADIDVFLQQIVFDRLLYLEGMKMDISKRPDMQRLLREGIYRAYSSMYVRALEEEFFQIDDKTLLDFYESNRELFYIEPSVELQLIYIQEEDSQKHHEKMKEIEESLAGGLPFSELAKKYSADPSAEAGGYTGPLSRDVLDERIAHTAFSELEIGEVSAFIETDRGYAIIKLLNIEEGHIASFEDSKELIRREILKKESQAYQENYYRKIEKLRSELIEKYNVKFIK